MLPVSADWLVKSPALSHWLVTPSLLWSQQRTGRALSSFTQHYQHQVTITSKNWIKLNDIQWPTVLDWVKVVLSSHCCVDILGNNTHHQRAQCWSSWEGLLTSTPHHCSAGLHSYFAVGEITTTTTIGKATTTTDSCFSHQLMTMIKCSQQFFVLSTAPALIRELHDFSHFTVNLTELVEFRILEYCFQ